MSRTLSKAMTGLGAGVAVGLLIHRARKSMGYSFRGKVVAITGGSRGLGLLLARESGAQGARLALLARDESELQRAEDECDARGIEVLTIACDIRSQDSVRSAVRRVVDKFGRIDVLINDAGTMQVGPLEHLTVSDFEEALAVHTYGPLYMILAVMPHMLDQGGGRIVNIASIGGKIAFPHLLPYTTSKFALVGLSDGMRAELRRSNILVTTVCPGLMRTGSPINVGFKGNNRQEQTWFTISDSLPLLSMNARRAARRILEACRLGKPVAFVSLPSRLGVLVDGIAPALMARLMATVNRFLPGPASDRADESFTGAESRTEWSPSLLTRLTDRAAIENNELRGNGKRHD